MSQKHDKHKTNEEEDEDSMNKLNINEEYAERFKYNEKRKEMEKNRNKYGTNFRKNFDNDNESGESGGENSPEESEDSEGELDNEIVRDKFINTLLELKDEKETKKLIENKNPIFTDDDFKQKREKIHKKEENEKIEYGIKDALLDNNNDNSENKNENNSDSENNIYSVNYKPKKIEEDQTEKNEFISAANKEDNDSENSDENGDDFFDNGLLIKKKVNKDTFVELDEEKDNKEETNKNETPEEAEEKIAKMTLSEALKKSKIKTKNVNMDLLEQIWGDDKKLSKNERFLRNYILSEGWLDKNTTGLNKNLLLIDKEDEENEDKFDEFENKYNHRFEEEGGANITTYQRNIDSYRHKDDTRAVKRKEHEKRKEEEKKKFKEELKTKKLKQAEEIKEKINKLERIAGTEKIGELLEEFENKDFNMDEFDQKMNDIFNKEYYNKELDDEEMEKFNAKQERHLQLEEKEEEQNNEENENDNNNEEENNENELWFYCDSCKKPLKEGKIKYECKTCEDYTLCKKCFKKIGHEHKMKKDIVPAGCNPPENAQELIEKVEKEQEDNILKCSNCHKIIVENRYYICNEETCKDLKFCKTCRGLGKSIHEHKLIKYIIENEENENEEENKKSKKEKLTELIDEKANYTIDDVIDGEIGTKFHYTKVAKEDSGLTDDMLLLLDDKILNKYLPLKKITAYSDYKMPEYKKKIMLNRLEKLVNKKKKELANEYEIKNQNEKENEKFLIGQKTKGEHNDEKNENKDKDKYNNKYKNNKNNKNKNDNNKGKPKEKLSRDEFKKQKRLETYGITENNI